MSKYNFDEYITPVWKGNKVYNESISFIPNPTTGKTDPVPLLYTPTRILSVCSHDLKTEYQEGTDYILEDGCIVLTKDSRMKAWEYDEFYMKTLGLHAIEWLEPRGRYVNYQCGSFHAEHQYAVTYEHDDKWWGIVPQFAGALLPVSMKKLNSGKRFRILFYGDSITHGAEVSSYGDECSDGVNFEPYMPIYPKLVTMALNKAYPLSDIEYINTSMPGKTSLDGLNCVNERVIPHKADLVVIAFGMNDLKLTMNEHKENIIGIMDAALSSNPKTEFILVSTTLPNTDSNWLKPQHRAFESVYREIQSARDRVAIAPMTSIHRYLIVKKRFEDMCGNGINHPNDFLARVYAQTVSALLIK